VQSGVDQVSKARRENNRLSKKLNERRLRVVRRDGDAAGNLFLQVIDHQLANLSAQSAALDERDAINTLAITMLESYEFIPPPEVENEHVFTVTSSVTCW
jgi:hypothetical protein